MKVFAVLRESVKVYLKNFPDLMGAYLIQAVLRAMCFVPLLFLLDAQLAPLAWLCVPMYLLIALPARQNYAIAMQDMLHGGRVLSPRLISFDGYFAKLWRGVKGMLKICLWMLLPALLVLLLVQLYQGDGWLCSVVLRYHKLMQAQNFAFADLFREMEKEACQQILSGRLTDVLKWVPKGGETVLPILQVLSFDLSDKLGQNGFFVMSWFGVFGDGAVNGLFNLIVILLATFILPVIGCAVHCGVRHAAALEDKTLLRGQRLKLMLLWALGFIVFLPFALVAFSTLMSDLKSFLMGFVEMYMTKSFAVPALGEKLYLVVAAFALLVVALVPFKQLIPAVAVHQQMKKQYGELDTNAQA